MKVWWIFIDLQCLFAYVFSRKARELAVAALQPPGNELEKVIGPASWGQVKARIEGGKEMKENIAKPKIAQDCTATIAKSKRTRRLLPLSLWFSQASVIHSNSQPWRAQRARSRASSQPSRSTLIRKRTNTEVGDAETLRNDPVEGEKRHLTKVTLIVI